MYKFRTTMLQSDGNAYIYLKALLPSIGDRMTFTVLDEEQFEVVFTLQQKPSDDDIEVNGLEELS